MLDGYLTKLLFSITRKDLQVDFFRAGGNGGQKQNKTSSAVRITHPDSGAVGEARDERQQTQNRKNALNRLVEHPKFRLWIRMKASAILKGFRDMEDKVHQMMHPRNLKVEELNSYTCDRCNKKSELFLVGVLPPGWILKSEDFHLCPSCKNK
jgi:protein subunit release factor B